MYTYLVIDDETLVRKGVIKKLACLSDQVICCGEAENGMIGIRMAEELHPDIIILDMQMPVMDGMQLLPYLSEHFPDTALVVISGYQNFEYVKQALSSKAVDYILKPFSREEIQKTILSVIDMLQNKSETRSHINTMEQEKESAYYHLDITLLENLIMGYETASNKINSCKLDFINHSHGVVLHTIYFHENFSELPDIPQWLDSNGWKDISLYLPSSHLQQFSFILQFFSDDFYRDTSSFSELPEALADWLGQSGFSFYIGISKYHNSILELHKAFRETREALNCQKIAVPGNCCLVFRDITPPISIQWNDEDEFLFRIESGNIQKVTEMSEHLFAYYLSIPGCTLTDVKHHFQQIIGECRNMLNYYLNQQQYHEGVSPNMLSIVNTLFSLNDLKEYYIQFFLNLSGMLQTKSVYANNDLIYQIQIYMQRNYQKNLTQEFIASLFYLNRSYLSYLFRLKTGEKFVDYLNNIRIDKSKELLSTTDWKLYSIAKAVGYGNTKYFFRIFKKKTGISPEKYREQHR